MRWRPLAAGALVLTLAACGGGESGSGKPSGRSFATETWYEASPGASPDEVVVRFDGPHGEPGDECAPERDVTVEDGDTEVKVTVRRFAPSPVVSCPASPQTMTAKLPRPLGDRPLVNPQTGWSFRSAGGKLALDPDSTPCARADCSAPAVAKASCHPFEYGAVVDEQLKPAKSPDQDVRCDGSFLVLTRDGRRAWFVNKEGGWQLLTMNLRTCDDVWASYRIRYPATMCK
jgi:hypothetical protein